MSARVRVRVPGDATTLIGPSGDVVIVKVDEAGRWAEMLADDARLIINSGLADCIPWRELNPTLIEALGPLPRQRPGHRIVDLQAVSDAAQPINPFDKAGIARQSLSMLRRAR